MKTVDLTKITVTVSAADIYGRGEIEIPDEKRFKKLATPKSGDELYGLDGQIIVAEYDYYSSARIILEPVPMRRTIKIQETGEKRPLRPHEPGMNALGSLIQFSQGSVLHYDAYRVLSDREEPEHAEEN